MTTLGIGGALLFAFLILIWWLIRSDLARRNRAEAAIRDREARIRRLVDANLIGVLFSNDGGRRRTRTTRSSRSWASTARRSSPTQYRLFGFTAPGVQGAGRELREGAPGVGHLPAVPEGARPARRLPRAGPLRGDERGHGRRRSGPGLVRGRPVRAQARRGRAQPPLRGGARRREGARRVPLGGRARDPDAALGAESDRLPAHAPGPRRSATRRRSTSPCRCEKQVSRLIRLADELLDVSRMSSARLHLSPEEMDVAQLARDVRRAARGERPPRRTALLELRAPRPVTGYWDRLRLDQALSNLAHERDEVRRRRADRRRAVGGRHGGDAFSRRGPRASAFTTRTSGASSSGSSARRRPTRTREWALASGSRARSSRRTEGRFRSRAGRAPAPRSGCVCPAGSGGESEGTGR